MLSQHKSTAFVEVELDLDGLPLTSAEAKATYSELKEYILKNDGLKVSSLYIAQVKSKLGLEKRENYNISKKEKAFVPTCPPEKEKAIIAALKHFKMI